MHSVPDCKPRLNKTGFFIPPPSAVPGRSIFLVPVPWCLRFCFHTSSFVLCTSCFLFRISYFSCMEQNPWKITGDKTVYQNPWIKLTEYQVINPAGKPGIYGKVHYKNTAVGIVAIEPDGMLFMVGQYRFVLDAYSWEIPEGGVPIGSDPLQGAQRELKEETGLVAAHWQEILRMHLSNSISDELAIIYLATGLRQETPEPEETEELAVKKMAWEEAFAWLEAGRITDAITVAALLKLKQMQADEQLTTIFAHGH